MSNALPPPLESLAPRKALSIQQPWAWLIVNGYKDVENRPWRTKFRGEFFVHAGKSFDFVGYLWVKRWFPKIPLPSSGDFLRGGLVGVATLHDCFAPGSRGRSECLSPWYFDGHGFALANAAPISFVALSGMLKFFEVPAELAAAARHPTS